MIEEIRDNGHGNICTIIKPGKLKSFVGAFVIKAGDHLEKIDYSTSFCTKNCRSKRPADWTQVKSSINLDAVVELE
jgi:hypothetical protein